MSFVRKTLSDINDIDSAKEKRIAARASFLNEEEEEEEDEIVEASSLSNQEVRHYSKCLTFLRCHWRGLIIIAILVMFTIFMVCTAYESKIYSRFGCIFFIILFWVTDVIPPEVTSLIPVCIFPIFQVMSLGKVVEEYVSETTFMILCGYIITSVIESCSLHKLIAVRLLLWVGFRVKTVHFILMVFVFMISSVCEETFVASLVYPIARAILIVLDKEKVCQMHNKTHHD